MENEYFADNPKQIPDLVKAAVADCHGVEPEKITQPLGLTIDVESMTRLWWPQGRFPYDASGELSFEYHECRITVTSAGRVTATKNSSNDVIEHYLENRDRDE
jgi:hypothetical protein